MRDRYWSPIPEVARKVLLFLGATVVVLGVVLYGTRNGNQNTVSLTDGLTFGSSRSESTQTSLGSSTGRSSAGPDSGPVSASLVVQVVGEVAKPGVYDLPFGSRVLDAVFAAGGFLPKADQSSVNLARPVNDGEQIVILAAGKNADSGFSQNTGLAALVNLNLADLAKLDTLPGIGPALAQRIVDYRAANGGFRSLDDLGKVAGIGQALMARLKTLVTI